MKLNRVLMMAMVTIACMSSICFAELIKIPISDQVKSFMDERHYNPAEIDTLKLGPNTNGERTFYIDGKNGDDSWDGLYPEHIPNTNHGPYKNVSRAVNRYDFHRTGERILFKSGYYRQGLGGGNLVGPLDEDHYFSYGPYGDGEVVIDVSMTPGLDDFSKFNGSVWKAKFNDKWPGFPNGVVGWAVMDWNHRSCREAIGYKGKDTGVPGELTTRPGSLIDSTKDFKQYKKEFGTGPTDFMEALIFNITDGSWSIVTGVATTVKPNDTLTFGPLTGGKTNTFTNGDQYAVYQLNQDGLFANVGDAFYIVSTKGEPRSRNLLANRSDWDNGWVPNYIESKYNYFYGLTIVGAPSIGIMTVGFDGQKSKFEKCRFLFTGKHATSAFGSNIKNLTWIKNFFYANVMMNWPRGNTWGGNGGWPNVVGGGGSPETFADMQGNIIINGGGEGLNTAAIINDNIIVDNYSMNLYVGDGPVVAGGYDVMRNDIIFTGFKPKDALDRFYMDESYNGWQRNYVKMHPNGIMIASERSGGGNTPKNFRIRNNNVIGHWTGIGAYFEVPNAGFQDSVIENNTIVLMTDQDSPPNPGLYTESSGLQLRARSGVDFNTIVRNNRIIGHSNADGKHNLHLTYGKDYSAITVDHNYYFFPGNDHFLTDTGKKNFDSWKALTGWDKNSVLATDDGLVGTDWSDSSKIFKHHLALDGSAPDPVPDPEPDPTPDPEPQPEPDPTPEPDPDPCPTCDECPACEVCQAPVVCPPLVICPAPVVCPEPTDCPTQPPANCNYEISVSPIQLNIKKVGSE